MSTLNTSQVNTGVEITAWCSRVRRTAGSLGVQGPSLDHQDAVEAVTK